MDQGRNIDTLLGLVEALRTPGSGCPWDLEQTFETIAPYTIEEAYEVADAIARGDVADLRDELGDLLLQVVFHSRIAEERGLFRFEDVAGAIAAKLVRRHPHVFGDRRDLDPAGVKRLWDQIKAEEKRTRRASAPSDDRGSALDGVPVALPALVRADKIGRRAAAAGFDWGAAHEVLAKIREEVDEVESALADGDRDHLREEIGDLLFAVTNLARYVDIDAEGALRAANQKFARRFGTMERAAAATGQSLADLDGAALDRLWEEAKGAERERSPDQA